MLIYQIHSNHILHHKVGETALIRLLLCIDEHMAEQLTQMLTLLPALEALSMRDRVCV